MSDSDYEWELRRWAEDELLDRTAPTLHVRGAALAAVGVLPREVAAAVVTQYRSARELRHLDPGGHSMGDAAALTPSRVIQCNAVIEQSWGTVSVSYLVVSRDSVRITASITKMPQPGANQHGHFMHQGPPSAPVTDSSGRRHTAAFSGGGSDTTWTGHWTVRTGLAAEVEWITFFGARLSLESEPSDVTVAIEELPYEPSVQNRARRHLERLVELSSRWHADELDVAADTFVRAGLLDPDDGWITSCFEIQDALRSGGRPSSEMPDRWRSVLTLRSGRGGVHRHHVPVAEGTARHRVLGVTTPVFDGLQVSVFALRATEFDTDVDFAVGGRFAAPHDSSLGAQALAVSAVDDLGNHYVGQIGQFSGGGDGVEGTYTFGAPLDSGASVLDLVFTGDTARAVVRVPLRQGGGA